MKLIGQVREACQTKHYSPRTEDSYARRIERFLRFHRSKTNDDVHDRNAG
ncbi:MAG: phage integrase N-terminal SAM-like domain-containing protein [Phycisphaerae bacterium]|nr:phage integrase N-terminal SAM-like domain-containing protein [Phycisphaerae bacterium]